MVKGARPPEGIIMVGGQNDPSGAGVPTTGIPPVLGAAAATRRSPVRAVVPVPMLSPEASSRVAGRQAAHTDPAAPTTASNTGQDPVGTRPVGRGPAGRGSVGRGSVGTVPVAVKDGGVSDDQLVEAVLNASRAMVLLTEDSIRQMNDDVTLTQYRTLVVLSSGPCRLADLADAMTVNPSTATRMCDRLVRKRLIARSRDQLDRREVGLSLTPEGESLVRAVSERRRDLVRSMLRDVPAGQRSALVESLNMLSRAVGPAPAPSWSAG